MRHTLLALICCALPPLVPVAFGAQSDPARPATRDTTDKIPVVIQEAVPSTLQFRQLMVVRFERPVWMGRTVLMGDYVIDHDIRRTAAGEPCTRIYKAGHLQKPIVKFQCTHLRAERSARHSVTLVAFANGMRTLQQFQFSGDDAAHGYMVDR